MLISESRFTQVSIALWQAADNCSKKKGLGAGPRPNEKSFEMPLVFAAGLQHSHDAQVRVSKKPLSRFGPGGSCCPCQRAQMLALRQGTEMLQADTGQAGHFLFGEELLAGLDPDHS